MLQPKAGFAGSTDRPKPLLHAFLLCSKLINSWSRISIRAGHGKPILPLLVWMKVYGGSCYRQWMPDAGWWFFHSSHLKLFKVYANELLCPLVFTTLEIMEKLSNRSNETRQNSILLFYLSSCDKFNCAYLPHLLPLFYFVTVVALIFF